MVVISILRRDGDILPVVRSEKVLSMSDDSNSLTLGLVFIHDINFVITVPTPDPALLNGGYYNGGYYNEAGQFHGGINGIGMNGPLNVELAPDVSSSSFISRGMRFRIVHNLIYFIIYLENRNGAYLQVSQPPIQRYCHKSAHRHKNGISQMVTQLQIPHSCQRDQVLRNSAKESREV